MPRLIDLSFACMFGTIICANIGMMPQALLFLFANILICYIIYHGRKK